jgi:chemotaxis response regulator CheB
MPRAAIERGHAMRVVSLDALANTLQAQCTDKKANRANAAPVAMEAD